MQTHDQPHNLFEEHCKALENQEPRHHPTTGDAICGALGLLVLVVMLLIATGTVPLYDWPS